MSCFLLTDDHDPASLDDLMAYLVIKAPTDEIRAEVTQAAEAVCDMINSLYRVADPAPAWAVVGARMTLRQAWNTRLSRTLTADPAGFLMPRAAKELMAGHEFAPLGFA